MTVNENFARRLFRFAGVYGLLAIVPLYFMEARLGRDFPPVITHPEFFYGFLGVTLAWQVMFLMLSLDPIRHRWLMLPAFLEKAAYGIAMIVLFSQERLAAISLGFAIVDLILGGMFLVAFWKTPQTAEFIVVRRVSQRTRVATITRRHASGPGPGLIARAGQEQRCDGGRHEEEAGIQQCGAVVAHF